MLSFIKSDFVHLFVGGFIVGAAALLTLPTGIL